jgi:hypothetical protein
MEATAAAADTFVAVTLLLFFDNASWKVVSRQRRGGLPFVHVSLRTHIYVCVQEVALTDSPTLLYGTMGVLMVYRGKTTISYHLVNTLPYYLSSSIPNGTKKIPPLGSFPGFHIELPCVKDLLVSSTIITKYQACVLKKMLSLMFLRVVKLLR